MPVVGLQQVELAGAHRGRLARLGMVVAEDVERKAEVVEQLQVRGLG